MTSHMQDEDAESRLRRLSAKPDRFVLWSEFLREIDARRVAEIGVYRGEFAARMLAQAPRIERYVMIDPWRHIPDWNKPANTDDRTFEQHFRAALEATEFAASRRQILRGTTLEVIGQVADAALDFAYIDADHTLRGITIDLISVYPKVKDGGWIAGDDFCDWIWQHPEQYEPTLVFPLAVYFAQAHRLTIYALPHNQFAMQKQATGFRFLNLAGSGYEDLGLRRQLLRPPSS